MPDRNQKDNHKDKIRLVVLAFSGGLDTSVILRWLQETYDCQVATFTADLGQGEEVEEAREKARALGVKSEHIFIEDLRTPFVADFVFSDATSGSPLRRSLFAWHGDCPSAYCPADGRSRSQT